MPRGRLGRQPRRPVKQDRRGREPVAQAAFQAKQKLRARGAGATLLPGRAKLSLRLMANPGETTAAQLLAFPGVRRVPSPRLELFDRPEFLPAELCTRLVALIDRER